MNEFVLHSKRLNIKNGKQKKIFEKLKKLKKLIILKDLLALINIFSYTPRKQSKKFMKQNELDHCKVKIL